MWGLVQDGSITKIINKPKGMVIGDTRHSRKIFELWSKAELEAIGIYEVELNITIYRELTITLLRQILLHWDEYLHQMTRELQDMLDDDSDKPTFH